MLDSEAKEIVHKLDTCEVDIENNLVVWLTPQERHLIRDSLLQEKSLDHQIAKYVTAINSKLGQIKLITSRVEELNQKVKKLEELINITYEAGHNLELQFQEHIDPEVILPRFKEELLRCLDEDIFRKEFQLKLLNQGLNPHPNNPRVDHVPDVGKKVSETGVETAPLYENTVKSDTPNETGKLVDSIIYKLDTADLGICDTFLVSINIPERIWLKKSLREKN